MKELDSPKSPDSIVFQFRTTQSTVDYLTGLAIVDDTTVGQKARDAAHDFLQSPVDIYEPIEPRKLIRKVEMEVPLETVNGLGILATEQCTSVDQLLHAAFDRYTKARLDSPELQQTLRGMIKID
jgi:hypothetical protein